MSYSHDHLRLTFLNGAFLLCITIAVGQQDTTVFAPPGTTWYYNREPQWGPPTYKSLMTFVAEQDSFILGYHARVIGCYIFETDQLVRIDSLTKYVSTIGSKVYYKVGEEFVVLYDFSARVGDTIHSKVEEFPINLGCSSDFQGAIIDFSYIIDSVNTIVIDGIELRTQDVHVLDMFPEPGWNFWFPIIERIGYPAWGSFWWGQGDVCILEGGFLRCYVDPDITWHNPGFYGKYACDYTLIASVNESTFPLVYPNPSSDFINVPDEIVEIIIYDLLGKEIAINKYGNQIDLGNQPPGIYFLNCRIDNELVSVRILKR